MNSDKNPFMGFVYGKELWVKEDINNALCNVLYSYESNIGIIYVKMRDIG